MERQAVLEMMTTLKLAGIRAAYDEVIAKAVKRQHSVEHVIVELLTAQLSYVRARSTAYARRSRVVRCFAYGGDRGDGRGCARSGPADYHQ